MPLPSPQALRSEFDRLAGVRQNLQRLKEAKSTELVHLEETLARAPKVDQALNLLSERMYSEIVQLLEEKLTIALQEVLGQPIQLKGDASPLRGAPSVDFKILRDGEEEDIMRGQGGSVANVLSVGLRMFALTTLDETTHRRFLVLDEPDCWIRPDVLPKLIKIIRDAGSALGFQVLLISHHDTAHFEGLADRIYRFQPQADGSVKVERLDEA